MKIDLCSQGGVEWIQKRLGVVTASEIDSLVTPLFKQKEGKAVATYLYEKITERATGAPLKTDTAWQQSAAMEQGVILETEALPWFAVMHDDLKVSRVGLCLTDDGRAGCSPDGLIGEDGGIEIKCPEPVRQVRYLIEGVVPEAYLPQIHFSMLVTGRPWWMFLSYARAFPPLLIRVERDEAIQAKLAVALANFNAMFDAAWAKVEQWPSARKH